MRNQVEEEPLVVVPPLNHHLFHLVKCPLPAPSQNQKRQVKNPTGQEESSLVGNLQAWLSSCPRDY